MDTIASRLRASEERLRHIVEHAQDLIYYCDAAGVLTFVNPAAVRVMKFPEDKLIGRHFLSLIREDYRTKAGAHYARQVTERIPSTYLEFPAVTMDGETVWIGQHVQLVFENGAVAAAHAIARDITRRREMEERLIRSEQRYRSLIHGAGYGIFRAAIDGSIIEANPAFAQMLGYQSPAELMARTMAAIYKTPEEGDALTNRFRTMPAEAVSADVTWVRKDGSEIVVHLSARAVDAENQPGGFEGIAEDITGKRAFEEQLRRAQKMEAVGLLARGIAHDFNNVLAAVLGTADLLALQLEHDPAAKEDADEIRKAAQRGAALTKKLLAFSRGQTVEPQRIDLAWFAMRMRATLERAVGADHPVVVTTGRSPAIVLAEPGQLEQVITNLVVNARDAMPKGGAIEIDVSVADLDERSAGYYSGLTGPCARLAVRDTGAGIDPEVRAHIFEPFFTTKGAASAGLGLSIVYGIVRSAGGIATVDSDQRGGTTFEVLLPLALSA